MHETFMNPTLCLATATMDVAPVWLQTVDATASVPLELWVASGVAGLLAAVLAAVYVKLWRRSDLERAEMWLALRLRISGRDRAVLAYLAKQAGVPSPVVLMLSNHALHQALGRHGRSLDSRTTARLIRKLANG